MAGNFKSGRKQGSYNKRKYPITSAVITQRQNAWAKALEGKKVEKNDKKRKAGELKAKITDGYSHLKVIKNNVNCSTCEIGSNCSYRVLVEEGKELDKCPMYHVYRDAVTDVTQNPLIYLAKTAARLEVALRKQQEIDSGSGKPLSKEMLQATKVALDAVKIAQNAEKGINRTGRRKYGTSDDEIIIDAEAFEPN